jgi:hypothetical protein
MKMMMKKMMKIWICLVTWKTALRQQPGAWNPMSWTIHRRRHAQRSQESSAHVVRQD